MVITYHGESCFKVVSGQRSVVLDPPNEKFKGDVIVATTTPTPPRGEEGRIRGAGEYELQEITIKGKEVAHTKTEVLTIYAITFENISILALGALTTAPSPELLEPLLPADILLIPVHKKYLRPSDAAKLVRQIKAPVVIAYPDKDAKELAKELGGKCEAEDKLTIKKKEIVELGEKMKLLCLKS